MDCVSWPWEKRSKGQKINIDMYTHRSDVVVKTMEFLLKCFADGKFPEASGRSLNALQACYTLFSG